MQRDVIVFPDRMGERQAGNLAYTVGRLVFRPGRPMLVEHVGGVYLEHDLSGRVITRGYGVEYTIVHVMPAEDQSSKSVTGASSFCGFLAPVAGADSGAFSDENSSGFVVGAALLQSISHTS